MDERILDYDSSTTSRKRRAASLAGEALVVFHASILSILIHRIVRDPCNHWGFDVRRLLILPLIAAAWSVWAWRYRASPKALIVTALLLAAVLAFLLVGMDRLNVLLDYDLWIQRGKPDRWQWH